MLSKDGAWAGDGAGLVKEGETRAPPQGKKSLNVSVGHALVGNGVISDY